MGICHISGHLSAVVAPLPSLGGALGVLVECAADAGGLGHPCVTNAEGMEDVDDADAREPVVGPQRSAPVVQLRDGAEDPRSRPRSRRRARSLSW